MARILTVDDDIHLLKVMQEWLTHEQHSVDSFSNGIEAWENLQSNNYDVAILDWDLPDIDGIDILKKFRAAGGTIPVLMLTGRSAIDNKVEGLDFGADDYITKPFHMKELAARIRMVLRKAETQLQAKPLAASNQQVLEKAELIGTSLAARYEFLETIGEGAFGMVFKARHPQLNKLVAIKMIQKNERNEQVVARFQTEARAISQLEHPNIALLYDFGTTERKQPFMVMEFINGKGLDQILEEQGKGQVPLSKALDILIQVCDGMSHAHAAGILHRDLKLSNLILKESVGDSPAILKIVDFGCAKLRYPGDKNAAVLTQVGQVVGSAPYMSPEQIQGKEPDERSDVYSLACVMYELLTGQLPHKGEDALTIMVKQVSEEPPSLGEARRDLIFPDEIEHLVAKGLAKDREQRFQSMGEFKEALMHFKTARNVKSSTDNWWQKLSKKLTGQSQ